MAKKSHDEDEESVCGPCSNCQFYDIDRSEDDSEGLHECIHPDLEEFGLLVSSNSGCNLFETHEDIDEDVEEDDDDFEDDYDDDSY